MPSDATISAAQAAKIPAGKSYQVVGVKPGLTGFVVKYDEKIYRGGHPVGAEGPASLRELGIRTIISVTPDPAEREMASANGFELVELPFPAETGPDAATREKFLRALREKPAPVFVHCKTGRHRAAAILAFYRIKAQGWTYEQAAAEYETLGGETATHGKLIESIKD